MCFIELKNVSLIYPLFGLSTRSIRKKFLSVATGGAISENEKIPEITALNNMTFKLKEGDRVGLIGHNGAGKSSLLKLLAGIYEPSSGDFISYGKVVSTLNISLGMDYEATGRENIISRCLFHGLSRKEIDLKINEIEEFTELGNYLDMPIRVYSSGMQTRLAFAAVTAIDSDILLMDEIIGTGDAQFIQKAELRMSSFMKKSKIMVLASHSDDVIKKFCNKAILIEHGILKFFGPVEEAYNYYYQ